LQVNDKTLAVKAFREADHNLKLLSTQSAAGESNKQVLQQKLDSLRPAMEQMEQEQE
jgi:hypothetical protein